MSLTNCRCCLRSPALQSSWASAAQRHIDSQRRASCRCAGSVVVSTSSPLSFESWSHLEGSVNPGGTHYRQSVIRSWPVARNRLDFVHPGAVAGQIAVVSVVVGKVRTRFGTALTARPSTRPFPASTGGSRCRATRSYTAYGRSGPPMAPGCGAAYRLAGARCSAHT